MKQSLFAVGLALLASSRLLSLDASEWACRQTVAVKATGPVRISLPAEILDAARTDLGDLRILAPDASEVPYAIVPRHRQPSTTERIPTQARFEEKSVIVEFGLAQARPIQRLRIETPAMEFTKGATVEVDDGTGRWIHAVDSSLVFRMPQGLEHVELDLKGVTARYLRLTLDNGQGPAIPITAVVVIAGGVEAEPVVDFPVTIARTEQEGSSTRLRLDLGLRHRPLASLVIAARETIFQRPARLLAHHADEDQIVEDTVAEGTFARLLLGERNYERLALNVDSITPSAAMELVLDDGNSPPLTDLRVTARVRSVDIGFTAASPGGYTLIAGSPSAAAPRYDIAAFSTDWAGLTVSAAQAGPLLPNPDYRPPQGPIELPEFGGQIDTAQWRIRRSVSLSGPGIYELELDTDALARSRANLADIRLVSGDRQIPYLLERPSRSRHLPLEFHSEADPKRTNVGRWVVSLPVAGVPAMSLRLAFAEPVFSRTVVVYEEIPDNRGEVHSRVLANRDVQRSSAEQSGSFVIPIQVRPETARFILEIDNGDNAPISPTKVELVYPVRRLRFRSTATETCSLLYGHPTVPAPRYDLQLAGARLLAVVPLKANVEPIPTLESTGGIPGFTGPAMRIVFWAALALVVGLLLWLVAKLLPKPPAS